MKSKLTQEDIILQHLKIQGSITSLEVFEWITKKNRYGGYTTFKNIY